MFRLTQNFCRNLCFFGKNVKWRNTSCHNTIKQYWLVKDVINDLLQEEISCQQNKFLAARTIFMLHKLFSHTNISCHREEIFLEEISCCREIFFTIQKISCHRKKSLTARRNFLSQEEIFCHRKNSFLSSLILALVLK